MGPEAIHDRASDIISSIFNVPLDTINGDSSPATIENWDSMGQLMLVLELEQQFGVQFSPEEVERLSSLNVIVAILQNKPITVG